MNEPEKQKNRNIFHSNMNRMNKLNKWADSWVYEWMDGWIDSLNGLEMFSANRYKQTESKHREKVSI